MSSPEQPRSSLNFDPLEMDFLDLLDASLRVFNAVRVSLERGYGDSESETVKVASELEEFLARTSGEYSEENLEELKFIAEKLIIANFRAVRTGEADARDIVTDAVLILIGALRPRGANSNWLPDELMRTPDESMTKIDLSKLTVNQRKVVLALACLGGEASLSELWLETGLAIDSLQVILGRLGEYIGSADLKWTKEAQDRRVRFHDNVIFPEPLI